VNYEFLGGNLALDFANTVHSQGMVDPCDDLKTAAVASGWSSQHVCVCFSPLEAAPYRSEKRDSDLDLLTSRAFIDRCLHLRNSPGA